MTTQPAPLLTAEDFFEASDLLSGYAVSGRCHDLAHLLAYYGQALADGRTACVRVLTEDECRAEFEAWWETTTMSRSASSWEIECAKAAYIACANALKAVKP